MRVLNILFILASTTARGQADAAIQDRAPGGPGCQLETAGYSSGFHTVKIMVDGVARTFLLFIPTSYQAHQETVLWLLGPGAFETAARFLHVSGLSIFAEQRGFAFAVLDPTQVEGLNVGLHGLAIPGVADDVAYARAILRHVSANICINMNRIRCAGYSRGARFCSRLGSELSSFVASIAPVSGLRFPDPNNATRKMPIIALHGTDDRINPYWGNGDPSYWNMSIPDAVQSWADFNGCKQQKWEKASEHIILDKHFDCMENADVTLVMITGDGHTWAGSEAFVDPLFGKTTKEKNANDVIYDFFAEHPLRAVCHTAAPGDNCYAAVTLAMLDGPAMHPEWGGAVTADSTFEEYQSALHFGIHADCPAPCEVSPDGFSLGGSVPSASMMWSNGALPLQHWARATYRSKLTMVVVAAAAAFAFVVGALAPMRARGLRRIEHQRGMAVASGEADSLCENDPSEFEFDHLDPLNARALLTGRVDLDV